MISFWSAVPRKGRFTVIYNIFINENKRVSNRGVSRPSGYWRLLREEAVCGCGWVCVWLGEGPTVFCSRCSKFLSTLGRVSKTFYRYEISAHSKSGFFLRPWRWDVLYALCRNFNCCAILGKCHGIGPLLILINEPPMGFRSRKLSAYSFNFWHLSFYTAPFKYRPCKLLPSVFSGKSASSSRKTVRRTDEGETTRQTVILIF